MQKNQQKFKSYLSPQSKKTKFKHFPIKAELIEWLQGLNFRRPTLVQAQSLPIILQDSFKKSCVIIYACNGAGKTLTYLISIFNVLESIPCVGQKMFKNIYYQIGKPQIIIVVSTQDFLVRVYEYLLDFADFCEMQYKWNLKIGRIYGDVNEKGHIIVGLTRKIQQRLKQSLNFDLSQLKCVVFDHSDKIKEDIMTQFADMLKLFSNPKINPSTANLLMTCTTGNKQNFIKFIQDNLTNHNILEIHSKNKQNKSLAGVTHFYSKDPNKEIVILNLLQQLVKIETKPQVIIFFNTIRELRNFYSLLKKQETRFLINNQRASDIGKSNLNVNYMHEWCSAGCHKDKYHNHPEDCSASKAIRVGKLRKREIQVLLATQTIGRGTNISIDVDLVINYNQPMKNKEERVGRTGRYINDGIALTFVTNNIFIKLAEQEQQIQFQQMKSEADIIRLTIECAQKNEKITEENSKHRFQYA